MYTKTAQLGKKNMKPRSKKAKGSRLERNLAQKLRQSGLDSGASRMPLSGAFETLKSDILTNLPVSFECKNQETWSPLPYMQQAKAGAKQNEIPVVVMSKNRLPEPLCLIELKDLIYLMQLAKEGGWIKELSYSKRKQIGK